MEVRLTIQKRDTYSTSRKKFADKLAGNSRESRSRDRQKKRDRENLFSAWNFRKFRPAASILLFPRAPRKHNILFSCDVFSQRDDTYLSMRLGGA